MFPITVGRMNNQRMFPITIDMFPIIHAVCSIPEKGLLLSLALTPAVPSYVERGSHHRESLTNPQTASNAEGSKALEPLLPM